MSSVENQRPINVERKHRILERGHVIVVYSREVNLPALTANNATIAALAFTMPEIFNAPSSQESTLPLLDLPKLSTNNASKKQTGR